MDLTALYDRLEAATRAGEGEVAVKVVRDLHPLDLADERSLRVRRGAILLMARFSDARQRQIEAGRFSPDLGDLEPLKEPALALIGEARRFNAAVSGTLIAQCAATILQALSHSAAQSPVIFISYRREDSGDAVARLSERLLEEFGAGSVFRDIDSIPIGSDFRSHLVAAVGRAAVCLVVIGPSWLTVSNDVGQRRLEQPDDWVRVEIETALQLNRGLVVPVLTGKTDMPSGKDLPPSIADLSFREGQRLRGDPDFHNDATRLIERLRLRLNQQ
jgi:hypothetical protein